MGDLDVRADELRKARNYVRRCLSPVRTQLVRLLDHIDDMEDGDLDRLHGLAETYRLGELSAALRNIHLDCQRAEVEPDPSPPVGRGGILRSLREALTR